ESDGWQDLTNVRREVDLGGLPVELLGLDDAHIWRHDLRIVPRTSPERFGFAVMHSPDSAPEAAASGYELIVAGHSHGGQIALSIQPGSKEAITAGTGPRGLAMTGVPQAIALVITRPKGSSQSIGNRTVFARRRRFTFSSWVISPMTTASEGRFGLMLVSHSSCSLALAIFTAETSRSPAPFAASIARF